MSSKLSSFNFDGIKRESSQSSANGLRVKPQKRQKLPPCFRSTSSKTKPPLPMVSGAHNLEFGGEIDDGVLPYEPKTKSPKNAFRETVESSRSVPKCQSYRRLISGDSSREAFERSSDDFRFTSPPLTSSNSPLTYRRKFNKQKSSVYRMQSYGSMLENNTEDSPPLDARHKHAHHSPEPNVRSLTDLQKLYLKEEPDDTRTTTPGGLLSSHCTGLKSISRDNISTNRKTRGRTVLKTRTLLFGSEKVINVSSATQAPQTGKTLKSKRTKSKSKAFKAMRRVSIDPDRTQVPFVSLVPEREIKDSPKAMRCAPSAENVFNVSPTKRRSEEKESQHRGALHNARSISEVTVERDETKSPFSPSKLPLEMSMLADLRGHIGNEADNALNTSDLEPDKIGRSPSDKNPSERSSRTMKQVAAEEIIKESPEPGALKEVRGRIAEKKKVGKYRNAAGLRLKIAHKEDTEDGILKGAVSIESESFGGLVDSMADMQLGGQNLSPKTPRTPTMEYLPVNDTVAEFAKSITPPPVRFEERKSQQKKEPKLLLNRRPTSSQRIKNNYLESPPQAFSTERILEIIRKINEVSRKDIHKLVKNGRIEAFQRLAQWIYVFVEQRLSKEAIAFKMAMRKVGISLISQKGIAKIDRERIRACKPTSARIFAMGFKEDQVASEAERVQQDWESVQEGLTSPVEKPSSSQQVPTKKQAKKPPSAINIDLGIRNKRTRVPKHIAAIAEKQNSDNEHLAFYRRRQMLGRNEDFTPQGSFVSEMGTTGRSVVMTTSSDGSILSKLNLVSSMAELSAINRPDSAAHSERTGGTEPMLSNRAKMNPIERLDESFEPEIERSDPTLEAISKITSDDAEKLLSEVFGQSMDASRRTTPRVENRPLHPSDPDYLHQIHRRKMHRQRIEHEKARSARGASKRFMAKDREGTPLTEGMFHPEQPFRSEYKLARRVFKPNAQSSQLRTSRSNPNSDMRLEAKSLNSKTKSAPGTARRISPVSSRKPRNPWLRKPLTSISSAKLCKLRAKWRRTQKQNVEKVHYSEFQRSLRSIVGISLPGLQLQQLWSAAGADGRGILPISKLDNQLSALVAHAKQAGGSQTTREPRNDLNGRQSASLQALKFSLSKHLIGNLAR